MAQVCELTGKRPAYGNKVSHSNRKTRTRWMPNLRSKKYEVPELKQTISLLLSTRAIRTIDKFGGITPAVMNAKESLLSPRLQSVRNKIYKARVKASAAPLAVKKTKKVKAAAKTAAAVAPAKATVAPAKTAKAKKTKTVKAKTVKVKTAKTKIAKDKA